MDIKEKKKLRFQFLKNVYESTEGDEAAIVDGVEVGKEIGAPYDVTSVIVQYLAGEGLITFRGMGLHIGITHAGVLEIEEALENPDEPTEHFLPVNIISIGSMVNSTIQQGSSHSTQIVETKVKEAIPDLKEFLQELKASIDKLSLPVESKQEMTAEIATIESQVSSPKPKSTIIKESLSTIRNILEGIATEAMAPFFIQKIGVLLSTLAS